MHLDVSTLTFAGGLVAFASGMLVLLHWWQAREDRSALSWGTASCAMGVGVTLLAVQGGGPDDASKIVGPIIICASAAETWAASRIFARGSVNRRALVLAETLGLAILLIAGATGHVRIAATLNLGTCASLYAAAAVEFSQVRSERPRGRWPMVCLLGLQSASLLLVAADWVLSPSVAEPTSLTWFGAIHFVALIYSGGSAICLITMLKDRSESKHKAAALTDPLTGLANRRATVDFVERMMERSRADVTPISVLAFDLDRFKRINDTFGHPTGDQVLRIFADVLASAVSEDGLAGRMGGEEFALALEDCDIDRALAVAGRIRVKFQDDARFVDGQSVNATVSIGVATAPHHGASVADIFASADIALYRAKNLGRNRVILSLDNPSGGPASTVTRIA